MCENYKCELERTRNVVTALIKLLVNKKIILNEEINSFLMDELQV